MRISAWSSDVCSSDLFRKRHARGAWWPLLSTWPQGEQRNSDRPATGTRAGRLTVFSTDKPLVQRVIRVMNGVHDLRPVGAGECETAMYGVEVAAEHEEQAEKKRHALPYGYGPLPASSFVCLHHNPVQQIGRAHV